MPRAFYLDRGAVRGRSAGRLWHGGWLFAGFAFEIPKPGDFLTLTVDTTPVLVIRGDDRSRARVPQRLPPPRHRSSAVPRPGHVRAIVCPYHSWTYARQRRTRRLSRHARRRGQVAAGLEAAARRSRGRPDLRFARRLAPRRSTACASASPRQARRRDSTARAWRRRSITRSTPTGSSSGRTTASATTARRATRSTSSPTSTSTTRSTPPTRSGRKSAAALARIKPKWGLPGDGAAHPKGGLATFPDPDHDVWYTSQSHGAGRGLRHRVDGRQARRAADGRLP